MGFFAWKEGVGEDSAVEVASEDVLDLASNAQLGGSDDWEFRPLACEVVADPKGPFISASSLGLNVCAQLSRLIAPVSLSLKDVVVTLAADYLSPQSQLSRISLQRQTLCIIANTLRDLKMRYVSSSPKPRPNF
jgi:hypothetical protein